MSSNHNELTLLAIGYFDQEGEVSYKLGSDGIEYAFSAKAKDIAGIKAIEIPEQFEEFLRPYCAVDSSLVKRIVALSWKYIGDRTIDLPVRLI